MDVGFRAEGGNVSLALDGKFHLDARDGRLPSHRLAPPEPSAMRDDYIKQAAAKITDPNILINLVSLRVKQLKRGNRPLVESLEKLSPEDTALREIIEEKISYEAIGA